jgi:zinc protease
MSRGDIVNFYQQTVMPNNAVLAVFGDIEPEEMAANTVAPLTASEQVRKKTEKVSAAIYLGTNGMTLKDPERPTLDVIDAVLSGIGYPSGWLQEALRGGDRSLVYVVHAFPNSGIDGGHFGRLMMARPAVQP